MSIHSSLLLHFFRTNKIAELPRMKQIKCTWPQSPATVLPQLTAILALPPFSPWPGSPVISGDRWEKADLQKHSFTVLWLNNRKGGGIHSLTAYENFQPLHARSLSFVLRDGPLLLNYRGVQNENANEQKHLASKLIIRHKTTPGSRWWALRGLKCRW